MNASFKPRVEMLEDRLVMNSHLGIADLTSIAIDPGTHRADAAALTSEPGGDAVVGGNITVYWHVIRNSPTASPTGHLRAAEQDDPGAAVGGLTNGANTSAIGLLIPAVQKVREAAGQPQGMFLAAEHDDPFFFDSDRRASMTPSLVGTASLPTSTPGGANFHLSDGSVRVAGGWGASSYQYAFQGTYGNTAHETRTLAGSMDAGATPNPRGVSDDVWIDGKVITDSELDARDTLRLFLDGASEAESPSLSADTPDPVGADVQHRWVYKRSGGGGQWIEIQGWD